MFSADPKHVVFTTSGAEANTYTTRLGVIDTTSGTQIGSTLGFSGVGGQYSPIFSDDGTRVLILNGASGPPKPFSTRASVVSTITGAQIGTTLTFAGGASGVLSADGAHALIIAVTPHWLTLSSTTRVDPPDRLGHFPARNSMASSSWLIVPVIVNALRCRRLRHPSDDVVLSNCG